MDNCMKKRLIKRSVLGIIIAIIAVIALCNMIVEHSASGRTYDNVDEVPAREYALLLGTNPVNRWGNRNQFYHYRIESIKELYSHSKVKKIIISGAQRNDYDEPTAMHDELTAMGIPDSVITLDGSGFNTLLSIQNTHAAIDSVTVVSQKFHNQRAIYFANHEEMDAIGYNAVSPMNALAFRIYAREALARVKAVANMILQY